MTPAMVCDGRENPSSSPWLNPDPEITPGTPMPSAPMPSSPPAAAIIPIRSTTSPAFPICSGALDIRARAINDDEDRLRACAGGAHARGDVPDEVAVAYGRKPQFGRDYIIPDAL